MSRLREEEIRRLLRYLRQQIEDQEYLAEIEDELRGEDAEEFLRERGIHRREVTQRASEQYPERGAIAVTARPLVDESSTVKPSLSKWNGSVLERRRAEIESGAGGDHDLPYKFSLPLSMPQTLAWASLLVKVQRGELEP